MFYLEEGDVIELTEEHSVIVKFLAKDIYKEAIGTEYENKIVEEIISLKDKKYQKMMGLYAVIYGVQEEDSYGHGDNDSFPGGYRVHCRSLESGKDVYIYQSGCYQHVISDIKPIGRAKLTFEVVEIF